MKKISLLFFLFCILSSGSFAQFYYKDILSNKQLMADMAAYKNNKIKTIIIKSFEDDGSPSDGFFCQKKFSRDYNKSELFTRSNISGPSLLLSNFNNKGLLVKTHDSSDIAISTSQYFYDAEGRIISIFSTVRSQDDEFTNEITEEHIYSYNADNQPLQMIRVKNRKDSTVILFALDEQNNVAIEKDTKSGTKYYYYYDAKKRNTDIVQANDFKTGLMPDYVFEYNNSAGLLSQMTATEEGVNNYYVWKYTYDNGLRVKEKCFNKERRLMGSVEYEYK